MGLKVIFKGTAEHVTLPNYNHTKPICEYCYSKTDAFGRELELLYCRETGIFWCDKRECKIKADAEHEDKRSAKCWTGEVWLHPRLSHIHIDVEVKK